MSNYSPKATLLLVACFFISLSSLAQLPDGSIAPDFTAVDINGVEHTLSDYLNQGIPVVLEFSATWCGPCYNYHATGYVQDFYDTYGPGGTGEAMVLFLEADDGTTLDDLNGTGGNTFGDWVTGTNFPIIDDAESIASQYQIGYYPTILTVCPNGFLTEVGQPNTAELYLTTQLAGCLPASLSNDPALLDTYEEFVSCSAVDVDVTLYNAGLNSLTTVEITLEGCSSCPQTTIWNGLLETYQTETVVFPGVAMDQNGEIEFIITSPNDNLLNDTLVKYISLAEIATTEIHIDLTTDCWPEETTWEIRSEADVLMATGIYVDAETAHSDVIILPEGCYSFTLFDLYGDGMQGTIWGCATDGYARVYSVVPGTEIEASVLYENLGNNAFYSETTGIAVCETDCTFGCTDPSACNYDADAEFDNGMCLFVAGCTDPAAPNFDPTAECDDGSCVSLFTCAEIGNALWDALDMGIYPMEISQLEFGIPVDTEYVFNVASTFFEPGLNADLPIVSLTILNVTNEPEGLLFNWPGEVLLPGTQHCLPLSGTPTAEGLYEVSFNCEVVVQLFGSPVVIPGVVFTHTIEITPNVNGIYGCTYSSALNYYALATIDDGTCIFPNPSDLCGNGTFWNPISELCESATSCTGDLDGNGSVNSGDLLAFLAAFGTVCE